MSRKNSPETVNRTRYHHGDLRSTLLEAGLSLVRERGADAVTLREVARLADVSHTAPYHHFANKAALIEALAVEAFSRFTQVLHATCENTPGSPLERLAALGMAYVRFALENPEEFRLMHLPGLRNASSTSESSPVGKAASEAYQVVHNVVGSCQKNNYISGNDPTPYALTAWSTVHGLSVLLLDGLLVGDHEVDEYGIQLAEIVTQTLGQGLKCREDEEQNESLHSMERWIHQSP